MTRDIIKEIAESNPATYGPLDFLSCRYCAELFMDGEGYNVKNHLSDCLWVYCREQVRARGELLGMKIVVRDCVPENEVWIASEKSKLRFIVGCTGDDPV